ncbi:SRPBCC family protein [Phenylobacterium sp.]|uniref:SRPBCC family protein n=1 Tax=Phenylobacterium sp. TaxID=1871053 RepID=UPI0035B2E431
MRIALAALAALAFAGAARAEVVRQDATSFTSRNAVEARATPERAFAALGEVARWWNPSHTYSGDAARLSLPLQPGACFCETLPGGGVAHARVVMAWPAQGLLRLEGALGPLQQEGVSGALTFEVKAKGDGVEVVQTYAVGGARTGLAETLAGPVDQVMREQMTRFARYLASGRPE